MRLIAIVIASISMLVNCMTASAVKPVKTRLQNRYVLAGSVDEIEVFRNGIKTIHVVDENGEEWLYSYASMEETPAKKAENHADYEQQRNRNHLR